ncbi:hypothetical protein Vadar_016049 [Vaccinium darrowii]|uniref:Uncharacterized protein n=1 Tax=Vaccinium darrowii TaxID=229202 RepID=A0ACB7XS23_9ERIC|nr:hypothetical protein Vadar_016049 [Vaccinium darrowii]
MNTFVEVHSVPTMRPSFNMYLHVLLFLSCLLLPQPALGINTTATPITTAVDAITNSSFFIAKPGCNHTCGSLTVPYPFGIGVESGCFIDPEFNITCDTSSGPPKAFLGTSTIEVLSISQNQVRIGNNVASACYDNNGSMTENAWASTSLGDPSVSAYTFSDVANKFTVVGCDDYAFIKWTFENNNLSRGCMVKILFVHVEDEAIKKEQPVDAKVAETIAKRKEELDQVDSSAYQAGQNKTAKYYATGQVKEITNDI